MIWRLLIILSLMILPFQMVNAERLVADLSEHEIKITSRFAGKDLLLFGAIDRQVVMGDGGHGVQTEGVDYDVIVTVTSDLEDFIIRRKERISGIWVNKGNQTVQDVPGYFAMASNRPIKEILSAEVLQKNGLGLDYLPVRFESDVENAELKSYRDGLIRNLIEKGVYLIDETGVGIVDDILFRAKLHFPANMPVGNFVAEVFLVRDGQILYQKTTPLLVDKAGFERAVYNFAHDYPAGYGILAVLLALFAGWFAGYISQRLS